MFSSIVPSSISRTNFAATTIADLSFVTWNMLVPWLFERGASELSIHIETDYPAYHAWHQRLIARPSVVKVVSDRKAAMAQVGMVPN